MNSNMHIDSSYGALIGADVTDYVVILNSDDAVSAFSGSGLVTVGAGLDVAVGPLGRNGSADLNIGDLGCAAAYSYSHSRGLYAGVSLEGSVIFSRSDVNHRFYGRVVSPQDILRGMLPPPRAARPLYEALEQALSALPQPTYGGLAVLGPSAQNAGKLSKGGFLPPTSIVGATHQHQQAQGPTRNQGGIRGGVHNVSSFESSSTKGSSGGSEASVGRRGYTSHSVIQGQGQNLKGD
jgi:Las17-binding protein actin regulator